MGDKKFKKDTWNKVAEVYGMTLEQHTRKQAQMHMAAQAIANRLAKKSMQLTEQQWFVYGNAYFSMSVSYTHLTLPTIYSV